MGERDRGGAGGSREQAGNMSDEGGLTREERVGGGSGWRRMTGVVARHEGGGSQ